MEAVLSNPPGVFCRIIQQKTASIMLLSSFFLTRALRVANAGVFLETRTKANALDLMRGRNNVYF